MATGKRQADVSILSALLTKVLARLPSEEETTAYLPLPHDETLEKKLVDGVVLG